MKRLLIILVVLAILVLSALFGGFPGLAIGAVAAAIIVLCYLIAGWLGFVRGMLLLALILSVAMGIFAGGNLGIGLPEEIIRGREAFFIVAGAVGGFVLWLLIVLATLFLSADFILASHGGDLWESFAYLVNSLLLERAGALEIVDKGEVRTIKSRGMLAPFKVVGYVIIYHGNAVVFERFGRPSQVAGPSLVMKKAFETIRTVIDLRMQVEERTETLCSRDGIPLTAYVRVFFQIDSGALTPTPDNMYPFSKQAVLDAAYLVPDWKAYTVEAALALLRDMICKCYLEEIYNPLKRGSHSKAGLESHAERLQEKLQTSLSATAIAWGVRIHRVELGVKAPREIEEQALAFEKAKKEEELEYQRSRAENRRIKEFVAKTGGSVTDYAMLRYLEKVGEARLIPPSLERMFLETIQREGTALPKREGSDLDKEDTD